MWADRFKIGVFSVFVGGVLGISMITAMDKYIEGVPPSIIHETGQVTYYKDRHQVTVSMRVTKVRTCPFDVFANWRRSEGSAENAYPNPNKVVFDEGDTAWLVSTIDVPMYITDPLNWEVSSSGVYNCNGVEWEVQSEWKRPIPPEGGP